MDKHPVMYAVIIMLFLVMLVVDTLGTRKIRYISDFPKNKEVPETIIKIMIGPSQYRTLSFCYLIITYMITNMNTLSSMFVIIFYLLSGGIGWIWTNIRVRQGYEIDHDYPYRSESTIANFDRLKLLPLPLWIDLLFSAGSILLAVLISYLCR